MSCETSNRLLTISFYNPCWQCSIAWGCSASDGPLEWTKKLGMFTSVWMCLESTTALYLDGVSVPSPIFFFLSLSLSPNFFRDFCRCTGIIRSCPFLYSVPSLNSASCQASPTLHCWHHCESDLSYQDFPMSSQRRAATRAIWVCFRSLTASSLSLDFVPVVRMNDEQSTAEVLHNRRKISSNWTCFSTSVKGHLAIDCDHAHICPCKVTESQEHDVHYETWKLGLAGSFYAYSNDNSPAVDWSTRAGGFFFWCSNPVTFVTITSQESYLRVTWICVLLLHWVLACGRHHGKAVTLKSKSSSKLS